MARWNDPRLRRTLAMAHMNHATELAAQQQYATAIEGYRKAIQADREYEVSFFNLALLLATCSDSRLRQPDEAVRLAEEGCQRIEHPNCLQLGILAQVYAETGRFDQAAVLAGATRPRYDKLPVCLGASHRLRLRVLGLDPHGHGHCTGRRAG